MLTPRLPVSLDVPLASAVVVVVLRHDEALLRDVGRVGLGRQVHRVGQGLLIAVVGALQLLDHVGVRVLDTHAVPPSLEDARASVPGETIAHTTPSGSGATRSAG